MSELDWGALWLDWFNSNRIDCSANAINASHFKFFIYATSSLNFVHKIALLRVFPNAIVLTTKSHFDVRKFIRHYEAWW